jgi:hypothetical protein
LAIAFDDLPALHTHGNADVTLDSSSMCGSG